MSSIHCFGKYAVAVVVVTLSLISTAMAASFNCKKAVTNVEKMICRDDELSKLDELMKDSYATALRQNHIKNTITPDQMKWLRNERDTCQDVECLKRAYKHRIGFLDALSSNRIVIIGGASGGGSSGQQLHFGSPVKADPKASVDFLPLSPAQPPRELTEGAEVILISGYEPSGQNNLGAVVKVDIDRPGSKVLLILTSYEKISWQVSASNRTIITGILLSGDKSSSVTTSIQTRGFSLNLPYAYQTESANFQDLLNKLNGMFGIGKLDVFRGSYYVPSVINVSSLDPTDAGLTKERPMPQRPRRNFTFEIPGTGSTTQVWSLTGKDREYPFVENASIKGTEPRLDQEETPAIFMPGKLQSKYGNTVYRLHGDNLEIYEQDKGKSETEELPPNFPEFSWPAGIAYDSTRDIVSITTFGGEGFLYRFDANTKKWIDFRSLNNVDICSLSYDKSADRYIAWGALASDGQMIFISGEGEALFARKVRPKLAGIGRLYDSGNGISPCLKIFPNGNDVALVFMSGNVVRTIWVYYVDNDTATLTYQHK